MMGIAPAWIWLSVGILLLAAETAVPGVFLIWIGLAALATGLALFTTPLDAAAQLLIFAALGLAMIGLGLIIQSRQRPNPSDAPFLNERARSLLGQVLPLESAIVNGAGSVRIGDSVWRVTGPEAAVGSRVIVTGVDGGTLTVEPA